MKRSAAHLKDDRLFECYLAARTGDLPDPRDAEHLADCPECTGRYTELAGFMEELRQEADAEVDALFPTDRLEAQRSQIARRISRFQRTARVISFPAREVAVATSATSRVPPRWLAAAAAAGLFIGVAVGGFLGPAGLRPSPPAMQVASSPAARSQPAPAMRVATPAEPGDDDAFLMELEMALDRPRLRELQPFDALTPHAREVGARVR
jgi:anti-sigma factor RsiW